MSFTPGPWSRNVSPARKYPTIFAGRNSHVCTLVSQRREDAELEANANLIAAAPELLEALKLARAYIQDDTGQSIRLPEVEAALAKAEGK